jgi:hypothetical protein
LLWTNVVERVNILNAAVVAVPAFNGNLH